MLRLGRINSDYTDSQVDSPIHKSAGVQTEYFFGQIATRPITFSIHRRWVGWFDQELLADKQKRD